MFLRPIRANVLDGLGLHALLASPRCSQLTQTQAIPVADLILTGTPAHRPTCAQAPAQCTNYFILPLGTRGLTPQCQDQEAARRDDTNAPAQKLRVVGLVA